MEIYDYIANNGDHLWGVKIFTDDTKTILSYEACGFSSRQEAEDKLISVLDEQGWE